MKLKKYDDWSLGSTPGKFQTEPYDSYGEGLLWSCSHINSVKLTVTAMVTMATNINSG